jgi:hypothetical protein
MASKIIKIALTVLTCTSLSLPPTVAEAGMRTGTWRNGMVAGPSGVGWYGRHGSFAPAHRAYYGGWGYGGYRRADFGGYGYHPRYYGGYGYHRRYYGGYGYAPAYYGGYGDYPGYYYRRRSNSGGAFAAGLIGGVALGAILASSAQASPRCYLAPRRVVSATGDTYIRRVRVCR